LREGSRQQGKKEGVSSQPPLRGCFIPSSSYAPLVDIDFGCCFSGDIPSVCTWCYICLTNIMAFLISALPILVWCSHSSYISKRGVVYLHLHFPLNIQCDHSLPILTGLAHPSHSLLLQCFDSGDISIHFIPFSLVGREMTFTCANAGQSTVSVSVGRSDCVQWPLQGCYVVRYE
jgi:hypothetical protein